MRANERGAGNFKMIATLLVIGCLIFLAIKLMPPYFANYELQSDLETVARTATYAQNRTAAELTTEIVDRAKDDGVTLVPENVTVERTASGVNIDVKYVVVVSLPGKAMEISFNPSAGNKLLTAR